jgi:hypothetical protein
VAAPQPPVAAPQPPVAAPQPRVEQPPAPVEVAPRSPQPLQLSEDGLPRRVRQASLAPQLREPSAPAPRAPLDAASGRSPEQIRSMMSAFQSGTRRGRAQGAAPTPGTNGANGVEPPTVPFRLSAVAGSGAGTIDVPFTGPLGGTPSDDEDWFNPPRGPAANDQLTEPEEDA